MEEKHAGSFIQEIRKKAGLSQRKLAAMSGISHTEISKIESNKRKKISQEIMQKIASALNIPYDRLLKSATLYEEFRVDDKVKVDFLIQLDESILNDTVVHSIEMYEKDPEWANIAYNVLIELPPQALENLKEYASLLLDKYEKPPEKK